MCVTAQEQHADASAVADRFEQLVRSFGKSTWFKLSPSTFSPEHPSLPTDAMIRRAAQMGGVSMAVTYRADVGSLMACMVRDCKVDKLTNTAPPGYPVDRKGAKTSLCFERRNLAAKDQPKVWLNVSALPEAVRALGHREEAHRAYVAATGWKPAPSFVAAEELEEFEFSAPDSSAFKRSLAAWARLLRSAGVAPDEDIIRDAMLPLASTRTHESLKDLIFNIDEALPVLAKLGVVL